jgi:hypothetical protein
MLPRDPNKEANDDPDGRRATSCLSGHTIGGAIGGAAGHREHCPTITAVEPRECQINSFYADIIIIYDQSIDHKSKQ